MRYRAHISSTNKNYPYECSWICEVDANSELDARIKVLAFVKEFHPGDLEGQRKYVQRWRERVITEVEVING